MSTASTSAPEIQRINMKLPFDLHEKIRKTAFERRVTKQQVVTEILSAHFGPTDDLRKGKN